MSVGSPHILSKCVAGVTPRVNTRGLETKSRSFSHSLALTQPLCSLGAILMLGCLFPTSVQLPF